MALPPPMSPARSPWLALIRLAGLSRDNLDEESGNQGEDERIAERLDDRRLRCEAQGFLLCRLTWSVTPTLF
jgi:hypothetical protein